MNEPKRLLDDAHADGELKALLRALDTPQPPSPEKQAALGQQLSIAGALSGMAAAPTSLWLKALVAGGAAAAIGVGIWAFSGAEPESAPTPAQGAPRLQLSVDSGLTPVVEPPAAAAAPSPPRPVTPPLRSPSSAPPRKESAVDSLAAEELLLERARSLQSSAPAQALQLLEQHRAKFPKGQLTAERMFLSVQVMDRLGNKAASQRQAEALIRQFPGSVYATRLKAKAP